jgi:hypothetical protein
MLWLISTIIWDNLAMTFIALIFNKSRFLNISNQYKFTYSFYCIYNVFSGLLIPNFAMEKAFELHTQGLGHEIRKTTAIYLIDGLYSNFHNLIFSAANYKILQPMVVQRLRNYARKIPKWIKNYREGKKKITDVEIPKDENSSTFNLISEMKRIKEETLKMQIEQETENDAIVFGLSFMTNCFFNVCFYGLLTPSVFLYLMPAYICFIGFDYLKFKMKDQSLLDKMNDSIRNSFKNIQKINLNRSRRFSSNKKENVKRIQAKIKQHNTQEIPWTIYINFLYMLLLGGFPLSLLGYFGLAKRFTSFLTIAKPLLKSSSPTSNTFHDTFFGVYDQFFQIIDRVSLLVFNESAIMMVETFTKNIKEMVKTTLQTLISDKWLIICLMVFLLILALIINFYRNERYINRIQSKIWNNTKVLEIEISGESFKNTNPAYKLLE